MRKLWLLVAIAALFAWPAQAQLADFTDIQIGVGSFFAEEDETFDRDSVFAAIHWNGLTLPIAEANTGVGVEVQFPKDSRKLSYAVWALNRIPLGKGISAGSDFKIAAGNETGQKFDWDWRLVVGASLGTVWGRVLNLDIYSLEEDRPFAFLFKMDAF